MVQAFLYSQSSETSIQDSPTSKEIDPCHSMNLLKTVRRFSPNHIKRLTPAGELSLAKAKRGWAYQSSEAKVFLPSELYFNSDMHVYKIADIVHAAHDLDSHDWWSPFFGSIHGSVPLRRSDGII